jgi:hypothetical protein
MNFSRILLGGLVAGLIMNGSEAALHAGILGDETALLYERFGIGIPGTAANLILLILTTFVLGLVAVWLYAAMRPRYGAGPRTALLAGATVWLLSHLWSGVYLGAGYSGIITPKLAWIPVAWGLLEAPLATMAGAAFYKESDRRDSDNPRMEN